MGPSALDAITDAATSARREASNHIIDDDPDLARDLGATLNHAEQDLRRVEPRITA